MKALNMHRAAKGVSALVVALLLACLMTCALRCLAPAAAHAAVAKPVEYKVVTHWDDAGFEKMRPGSVKIVVMRDGVAYEEQTLSDDNNWTFAWRDTDGTHTWIVNEVDLAQAYTAMGNDPVKAKEAPAGIDRVTITLTNRYSGAGATSGENSGASANGAQVVQAVSAQAQATQPASTQAQATSASASQTNQAAQAPQAQTTSAPMAQVVADALATELPHMSLFWWPAAALVACGLAFVLAGLLLVRRGRATERRADQARP